MIVVLTFHLMRKGSQADLPLVLYSFPSIREMYLSREICGSGPRAGRDKKSLWARETFFPENDLGQLCCEVSFAFYFLRDTFE